MISRRTTAPPSVSIIICTYQREQSLRNLLMDIAGQSVHPHEVIVIDQTPEHEPETAQLLKSMAPLVRVSRQSTPSLPAARNRGIATATGEVLLFVDDDARLPPSAVGEIASVMRGTDIHAMAPLVIVPGWLNGEDFARRYRLRGSWRSESLIEIDSMMGVCMAVRTEVFDSVGGFDEFLSHLHTSASGEDLEFTRRMTRNGLRLVLVPRIVVPHEAAWPGGAQVRTTLDPAPARRAYTYILLKENNALYRSGPRVVGRLLRPYVFRSDVLFNPRRLVQASRLMRADIRFIRLMMNDVELPPASPTLGERT